MVTSEADALLVPMGSRVRYVVTVSNVGDGPLHGVIVTDEVPRELDVFGVPIIDAADSINLIRIGHEEQIVWGFDVLEPGRSIRLPWLADVSQLGDFAATNRATAVADAAPAAASSDLYLAATGPTDVVIGKPAATAPRTVTRRVSVPAVAATTDAAASSAPGTLPATGVDAFGWVALAALLMMVGGAVLGALTSGRRRRPVVALAAAAIVTLTACVGSDSGSDNRSPISGVDTGVSANAQLAPPGVADEDVLGTRISRDEDERGNPTDGTPTAPTDVTVDPPVVTSPIPPDDGPATVTSFEVITIAPEPLPVVTLPSVAGENTLTFEWDESTRAIGAAASSRIIRDTPASVLTELSTGPGPINTVAVLTNESDQRLAVHGQLLLRVSGAAGSTELASDRIDAILEPGGVVTAPFSYLLPSGSYTATAVFEAG